MATLMEKQIGSEFSMEEVHFQSLDVMKGHPNVYSLTKICSTSSTDNRLLVASIHGGISSVEWKSGNVFESKGVHFTYIPGDAKIISIDSFNKWKSLNGLVIGITFVKSSNEIERVDGEDRSQFLNIYSDWKLESTEFDLNSIAEGCINLKLDFVPLQLTHTQLITDSGQEYVFLLSGSDLTVHMYKEDKIIDYHTFIEQPAEQYFPEFRDIPSSIHWMDFYHYDNDRRRLTAYGCQDGNLIVSLVDVKERAVLQSWSLIHDGPITTVQLFAGQTSVELPTLLQNMTSQEETPYDLDKENLPVEIPEVHLLVTGALEVSVVYRDVLSLGLAYQTILAGSNDADAVLCSCVADVDFDGENELLLGTYGQKLMVFRYQHPDLPSAPSSRKSSANSNRKTSDETKQDLIIQTSDGQRTKRSHGHYDLVWERNFAFPLFAIDCIDLTKDGMEEIVVLSYKGIHILQHNLEKTAELIMTRFHRFCALNSETDAFVQLQAENLNEES